MRRRASTEFDESAWAGELAAGCRDMGLAIDAPAQALLVDYLSLLRKWNAAYNLTAVRDPALMVRRHLLDSLSILAHIDAGPVLDVGTGAGLPGIPLAIALPGTRFWLLDTNGKKTRFVRQAVGQLSIGNVEVVNERVERFAYPAGFARILSRAFSSLADLVEHSRHLLAPGGAWLAMKGASFSDEIARLPDAYQVAVEPLLVPGEPGARNLVRISPSAD